MTKISKIKLNYTNTSPLLKIKLKSSEETILFAEDIINTVREPLLILDKNLKVIKVNCSFYDLFKMNSDKIADGFIYAQKKSNNFFM